MKYTLPLTFTITLFFLGGCAMFEAKQPVPSPAAPGKALAVPVGQNWLITEEPPALSGDRLPFQTEQSVQPAVAKPVSPADGLKIETNR